MRAAAAVLVVLLLSDLAAAGVLYLEDGRVLDGVEIAQTGAGALVKFKNGPVLVPKALIRKVDPAAEKAERIAWADRKKVEGEHLRYEHDLPDWVFERYRTELEGLVGKFRTEWKIEAPAEKPLLSISRSAHDAGPGGKLPEGLVLHDPNEPGTSLRIARHIVVERELRRTNPVKRSSRFPFYAVSDYAADPDGGEFIERLRGARRLELAEPFGIATGDFAPARAWSLVHFLLHSKKHADALREFVKTCPEKGAFAAFREKLGIRDVAAFEAEWLKHVRTLKLETPRACFEAGKAACLAEDWSRAKELLANAIDGGLRDSKLFYWSAFVAMAERNSTGAMRALQEALKIDPLDALANERLADVLEQRGAKKVGEKYRKLAAEIRAHL
jgi:hypothetical protein